MDAAGAGVAAGTAGLVTGAGRLGRYSEPVWPHPVRPAMPTTRASALTRICFAFNIREIVMTDSEYMDQAEALLKAVEAACDRINDDTDADVDNQRVGGMVTLTFANHSQIIINLQKPLQEVWMAARAGGFHYRFVDGAWQDTKGQGEFFAALSRNASEQSGQALRFTP